MIRKIPNTKSWILKAKDIDILLDTCYHKWINCYKLPILNTKIRVYSYLDTKQFNPNDYILVCCDHKLVEFGDFPECIFYDYDVIKLENIDVVNKIWDKFLTEDGY
jgi:hypothetical protein